MTVVLFGPTYGQLDELQQRFPEASEERLADGSIIVRLPVITLPAGWNKDATAVCFIIPVGYPVARPDCFFADFDLRLADGSMPRNAQEQSVPTLDNERWLWFSWHVVTWEPLRHSYVTFVRVIERRLSEAV